MITTLLVSPLTCARKMSGDTTTKSHVISYPMASSPALAPKAMCNRFSRNCFGTPEDPHRRRCGFYSRRPCNPPEPSN
nr:hypothetical protein Iba_chr08fCG3650 [Ipomoea batatas]